jgi:cytochrome P450
MQHRDRVGHVLYPNSGPDASFHEPLPPGPIRGCPFIGNMSWMYNMNQILYQLSGKLGSPSVWKFFALTKPMAIFSGSSAINQLLGKEFKGEVSQMTQFGNFVELFGNESLSFETTSKKQYQFMRQLVGQALTEEAVARGVPALQDAASNSIDRAMREVAESRSVDKMKNNDATIVIKDMCSYLTLEVAWRQIIGLDLKTDEEIAAFHKASNDFMKSFTNYFIGFLPKWMIHKTQGYKASRYLVAKIQDRIDSLLANGPDGSTMSAMVFATDEKDQTKKLSRQQVIDNAMLLIIVTDAHQRHVVARDASKCMEQDRGGAGCLGCQTRSLFDQRTN